MIPAGFAASLLFAIFGPYIRYSAAGYLDPWIYTGYFSNFSNINLAASVISLYYAVRWYYGTAPALVAALALLVNPYFNSAVG